MTLCVIQDYQYHLWIFKNMWERKIYFTFTELDEKKKTFYKQLNNKIFSLFSSPFFSP